MSPRKRQKTGNQTTLDRAWDQEGIESVLDRAKTCHPLAETILSCIGENLEKHGSISKWIASLTADDQAMQTYATALNDLFPAEMGVTYLGCKDAAWPEGQLLHLQLWMLSWSEKDGFSLPSTDEVLLMVTLILGNGLQTDPSEPGVEALAIKKGVSDPVFFKTGRAAGVEAAEPHSHLGIGSVGYVKGLKRSLAALAIAVSVWTLKLENFHESWPQVWMSMRTVTASYKKMSGGGGVPAIDFDNTQD